MNIHEERDRSGNGSDKYEIKCDIGDRPEVARVDKFVDVSGVGNEERDSVIVSWRGVIDDDFKGRKRRSKRGC